MIILPSLTHKKYIILGLGKSGLATAATLRASHADVVVWDDKESSRLEAAQAGYQLADPTTMDLTGYEALILSPGIPLTHPTPHPAVAKCRAANVPVIGDVDLLFQACPNAKYIGITGTNGKSTTTALIAHILKNAGHPVQVGGNLGTPVLSFDMLGTDGFYVLELSSFQLDLMHTNKLNVAVLLNITPDHLDRHGNMAGYIAAKTRIFQTTEPQTVIIGTDEPETKALVEKLRAQKNLTLEEISVVHPVAQGLMKAGQQLFSYAGDDSGAPVVNLAALPMLPGTHNAQNVAAAFAACRAVGLDKKTITQGLQSFPGLVHRQQLVATIDGVRFINDSKATNADAAGKALACYKNIYWIIGGKAKDGGLNGLESYVSNIRHAFIIGAALEQFASWCKGKVPYTLSHTLDVALEQAAQMALQDKALGTVLLSPACASYDQFNNFEERGETFITLVKHLQNKAV